MAHRIMARRQMELARRNRLLDARRRTLGQDVAALNSQVGEKRAEAQDAVVSKADDKMQAKYLDSLCVLQEQEVKADKSAEERGVRDYSRKYLSKQARKEYHLSDPDAIKREKVLTDEDVEQLGPGAILAYGGAGESQWNLPSAWIKSGFRPHYPEHPGDDLKAQKEEFIRQQLGQQAGAKAEEAKLEMTREMEYADQEKRANAMRLYCEQQQLQERRDAAVETLQFNTDLADHVAVSRSHAKAKDEAAKQAELVYNKTSQLLNEAEFQTGPDGRVLPDTFKRMTQQQQQVILDTQAFQMVEKRQRAEAEREEERDFVKQLDLQRQCVDAIEAEKERRSQAKRMAYANQFKEDMRSQAKRQSDLGMQYVNKADDSFFAQFGKSAR
jgi:hypothetical protein